MAQLTRVFTGNVPAAGAAPIEDMSFPAGAPVRVNIDAEERPGVLGLGGAFALVVIAINRNTGATVVPTAVAATGTPVSGTIANMGTAAWPATEPNRRFEYEIPAAFGAADEFCEARVSLRVGIAAPFDTDIASTDWMRTPA